jgi:hypothetical protein
VQYEVDGRRTVVHSGGGGNPDGRAAHFRTSGWGRATIVFTMPSGFSRISFAPCGFQTEFVSFADGDLVRIRAAGVRFARRGTRNRSTATLATVVLSPSTTG